MQKSNDFMACKILMHVGVLAISIDHEEIHQSGRDCREDIPKMIDLCHWDFNRAQYYKIYY